MASIQKAIVVYAVLSYLIFAGAALHLISPLYLAIAAGLTALTIYPLKRWSIENTASLSMTAGEKRAVLLIVSGVVIVCLHVLLIPPYKRDDMIYHLLVPKQIYLSGGLSFDAYNINANFPMLFEMPLTVLHALKRWISPFLANLLVLGALMPAVYVSARRLFGVNHALAAGAALLIGTTPAVYDQVHSCYVELFMSLLVLASFYNYLQFITQREQTRRWYLTMLFAGMLCATKYPGGFFVIFFLVVEFFTCENRPVFYRGILVAVAACLPWYLKNWIALGNPTFPMLNAFFHSDAISIERSIYFRHLFADYHMGRGFSDYLLLAFRLLLGFSGEPTPGQMGFGARLSLYFISAFGSLVFLFKDRGNKAFRAHRMVAALFGVYFVFWSLTSQQARFLLPVFILSSLAGLAVVNKLQQRHKAFFVAAAALILVQNVFLIVKDMQSDKIAPLLSGRISREQFLEQHMPISYGVATTLSGLLDPEKDRLFAVGTFGRNYYFNVDVVTNTYYEAEILARAFRKEKKAPELFADFVRKERLTHMLIHQSYLEAFFKGDPSVDLPAMIHYFKQLPTIFRWKAVVVYKLEPPLTLHKKG